MADSTGERLLDELSGSGIVPSDAAQALRGELPDAASPDETLSILIDRGLITAYQAGKVAAGAIESLVIEGRYQLRKQLGAGAMGQVFLARDERMNRAVAIKILPPRLVADPDAVARFQREVNALAQLSHPAIVQAHDAGSDGDVHYLVMEFVRGQPLSELLAAEGKLSPVRAAGYAYQVALGLEHAHRQGLVHRDLKPSNLLVNSTDQVKILDLGLAKFLQDQIEEGTLTREGWGLGTPDYMAPEQFADARKADARSDIYALGCTLYHMLTGKVPFPGSSLSEKARNHEQDQPTPIDEINPEVPGGLIAAVDRMMAKHPDERFQSAGEVAEALYPFVAGSTLRPMRLQQTIDWRDSVKQGGPASRQTEKSAPRRRPWTRIGAVAGAAVLLVAAVVAFIMRPTDESTNNEPSAPATATSTEPHVLTVAQDGSAQFTSINEAKKHASPGMTIRILDSETYVEAIVFTREHAGVTLEGVRSPTLKIPEKSRGAVLIYNAPDVQIRNLAFECSSMQSGHESYYLINVSGRSPGVVINRVRFQGQFPQSIAEPGIGVGIEGVNLAPTDDPVIVKESTFTNVATPIRLSGLNVGAGGAPITALPSRRVIIQDNRIENAGIAIWVAGELTDIQIVSNRIINGAIQLQGFLPGSDRILVANNTIENTLDCLRVDEPMEKVDGVQIRNNLLLHFSGPDMGFYGKDPTVTGSWKIANNVRRVEKPENPPKSWLLSKSDTDVEKDSDGKDSDRFVKNVKVVSRNAADKKDFLRPVSVSGWAGVAAGNTDPSLPKYVGAVPPDGLPAWDWSRTWRAPAGKGRLWNVSKAGKDDVQFRMIGEAIKAAGPWDTIRVLDGETYDEHIVLDDPRRHEGLVIETVGNALLRPPETARYVVEIKGVPHVRISGFQLRQTPAGGTFVSVTGHAPGVVLDRLGIHMGRLEMPQQVTPAFQLITGIDVSGFQAAADEPPLIVRHCEIDGGVFGVRVTNSTIVGLYNNRIANGYYGIVLSRDPERVIAAGNVIRGCTIACQMQELAASCQVLFANNTAFDSRLGLIFWSNNPNEKPAEGVEVSNNLFFDCREGDLVGVGGGTTRGAPSDELAGLLARNWIFNRNFRDRSSGAKGAVVFDERRDRRIASPPLVSRTPGPQYVQPESGSALATGGAGGDLPSYAGAVPPEGARPWDWNITWRSRMMRAKYLKNTQAGDLPATSE